MNEEKAEPKCVGFPRRRMQKKSLIILLISRISCFLQFIFKFSTARARVTEEQAQRRAGNNKCKADLKSLSHARARG